MSRQSSVFLRVPGENLSIERSEKELNFWKKEIPNDSEIRSKPISCTACGKNVAPQILSSLQVFEHPALGVIVCKDCIDFYDDGVFSTDEDGSDKFCRWCGQGGSLYCCSDCSVTFCKGCVTRNLPRKIMKDIEEDDWKCFVCKSEPIWKLRGFCNAVKNYCSQQKKNKRLMPPSKKSKKVRKSSGSSSDSDVEVKKRKRLVDSSSDEEPAYTKKPRAAKRNVGKNSVSGKSKTKKSLSESSDKEVLTESSVDSKSSKVPKNSKKSNSASSTPTRVSGRPHTQKKLKELKIFDDINNDVLNDLEKLSLLLSQRCVKYRKFLTEYNKTNVEEYVDAVTEKMKETFFEVKDTIDSIEASYERDVDSFRKSYPQHFADKKTKKDDDDDTDGIPIVKPANVETEKENKSDDDETASRATDVDNASMFVNITDLQTDLTDDEISGDVESGNHLLDETDSSENMDAATECDTKTTGPESCATDLVDDEPVESSVVADDSTNGVASDKTVENTVDEETVDSEGPASNSADDPSQNSTKAEDSEESTKKIAFDLTDVSMGNSAKAEVVSSNCLTNSDTDQELVRPEQSLPDLKDSLSDEDESIKNNNDNIKEVLMNSDSEKSTLSSSVASDVSADIVQERTPKTKRLMSVKERNKRVKQIVDDDDDSDKEIERLGNISSLKNMRSARNNNQETDGSQDDVEVRNDESPSVDHLEVEQDTISGKKNNTSILEFLPNEDDVDTEKSDDSLTAFRSEKNKQKSTPTDIADRINKQYLINSSSEENDDNNDGEKDSDIEIVHEVIPKKIKNNSKKRKLSGSSSDEFKKEQKEKSKWRKDRDLAMKLSDTDTSDEERRLQRQKNRQNKRAENGSNSSDSGDVFILNRKPVKRSRGVIISSDSDVTVVKEKEDVISLTSSDEESKKQNNKKNKKRRRIIEVKDDSSESDAEQVSSQNTPGGKGRKNIRKVLKEEDLAELTRKTAKQELERKKRILERQALFNESFHLPESTNEKVNKLVLDFDPTTKEEFVSVNTDLVHKLKPHQAKGIKFMWDNCFESLKEMEKEDSGGGCILAHCMGLGKTLQVITLVHTLMTHETTKIKTTLVICPLGTVLNWVDEFKRWLTDVDGGYDIEVYHIQKGQSNFARSDILAQWHKHGGVFIIGYEMFRNLVNSKNVRSRIKETFMRTLLDPGADLVICDEGHMLKNEKSAVSKSCTQIKTKRRIVLTGTPLQNNLKEYHCMVQFVKPNLLGDLKEFMNRFVNPISNGQYVDSTAQDVRVMKRRAHVLHKMLDGVVQRFDYNVLTPFLPPKQEYVISVTLTDLQAKLYECYLKHTNVRGKGMGTTLFQDFQVLRLIWTHPLAMKLSDDRKDKASEKKEMEASDSEGSLKDFVVEDSEEEKKSSSSSTTSSDSDVKIDEDVKNDRLTRASRKQLGMTTDELPVEMIETKRWWREFVTDEDLKNLDHSSKLVLLFAILKVCRQIGDKVLVFSQSIPSLDMIEHFLQNQNATTPSDDELDTSFELIGDQNDCVGKWEQGVDYFRLDGQTPAELRRKFTDSFNNEANTRARLFLISTRAGGLGINLVAANRVIIFDASWNPSHDVQSIFRVYRFGQKKPCYIYRFVAQGTMEEKIYERQVTKQSISCRVVDEQQIDRHFTASDLNELYKFERKMPSEDEIPKLPKDRLMAELLKKYRSRILTYHDHDSLLENVADEELTEDERKQAWDDYELEKSGKALLLAQQRKLEAASASVAGKLQKVIIFEGLVPSQYIQSAIPDRETIIVALKKEHPAADDVELEVMYQGVCKKIAFCLAVQQQQAAIQRNREMQMMRAQQNRPGPSNAPLVNQSQNPNPPQVNDKENNKNGTLTQMR